MQAEERRLMSRILYVAIAALACGAIASVAMGDWSDDFESYPDGLVPTPPYDPVFELVVQPGIGYGPSKGAKRDPGATTDVYWRGWALRAIGSEDPVATLYGKFILANPSDPGNIGDYAEYYIALVAEPVVWDPSPGNAWFAGNIGTDCVMMRIHFYDFGAPTGPDPQITFWSKDRLFDDVGAGDTYQRIFHRSLLGHDIAVETWYDVRIDVDWVNGTATGSYKRTTAETWTVMGDLPLPLVNQQAGVYNPLVYVGLSQRMFDAAGDDINVVIGPPMRGDIDVTVNLLDHSGDVSLMRVVIEVRDDGDVVVRSAQIAPESTTINHLFENLMPGTYSVKAVAPKWLSKTVSGVIVTPGGSTPVVVNLPNGDADGDNAVTNADLDLTTANLDEVGN